MSRAKGSTLPLDTEPATRIESNDVPVPVVAPEPSPEPSGGKGLARFGLDVRAVATPYWHPPDARERREPVRIKDILFFWDGRPEMKRTKTLPNGKPATVYAVFGLEMKAGGKRVWECLSSRALTAVNDVDDPRSWFVIWSKGSSTDKEFTARPWTADDERDAE